MGAHAHFLRIKCSVCAGGGRAEKGGTMEMQKTYNPKDFEERLYKEWMERGYFRAEVDENKVPFTIVIPPPNITG